MLKRLLIILMFCLPLQQVQPVDNVQKVQFGAKLFETLAGLWADSVDKHDSEFAKKAAIAKFLSRIAGAVDKGLSSSRTRDKVSKGLNAHAAAWQCAKDVEEFIMLSGLAKEHGEELSDEVLQEHYNCGGTWKDKVRPFVRLASFAVSAYSCLGAERRSHRFPAVAAQALVDAFLLYVSSDGDFKASEIIQAGEIVSQTAASGYDVLMAVNGFRTVPEGNGKASNKCSDCEKTFDKLDKVVGTICCKDCGHNCCRKCSAGTLCEQDETKRNCSVCWKTQEWEQIKEVKKNVKQKNKITDDGKCWSCQEETDERSTCGHPLHSDCLKNCLKNGFKECCYSPMNVDDKGTVSYGKCGASLKSKMVGDGAPEDTQKKENEEKNEEKEVKEEEIVIEEKPKPEEKNKTKGKKQ